MIFSCVPDRHRTVKTDESQNLIIEGMNIDQTKNDIG